jgi:DNA polymerase-1
MIAAMIRSALVARRGRRLVEADYKAVEVRVAACLCKDPRLMDYILDPTKDMHRDMAAQCFMLKPEVVTKQLRYYGKNSFVFPTFYGSYHIQTAPNLWKARKEIAFFDITIQEILEQHGITELGRCVHDEEVEPGTFVAHIKDVENDFWNNRFSVYNQWRKDQYDTYKRKAFFNTVTGFRCGGFLHRNDVINYPVQGPAFHCLLWSLIHISKELKLRKMRTKLIGQIHDSILADVPEEEMSDYLLIVYNVMTRAIRRVWSWLIVPLEVEIEASPVEGNWYQKQPISLQDFL